MSGPLPLAHPVGGVVADMQSAFFGPGASLTRTATTQATWTLSVWVYRCGFGSTQQVFGSSAVFFDANDKLVCNGLTSDNVYREPGWMHIFCNSAGVWVNGEQVTGTGSYAMVALTNTNFSEVNAFNGYMAQAVLMDGVTRAVTDCGRVYTRGNARWWATRPNSTLRNLANLAGLKSFALTDAIGDGTDASGLTGNGFTPVGMSQAANGSAHSPDNPHCLLNPLAPSTTGTLSDGNLTVAGGNAVLTLRPDDDGTVYYYEKDGVAQTTTDPRSLVLTAGSYNFGATAFAVGGRPLESEKLLRHSDRPVPAHQGADHFNALAYTGTGADLGLTGAGFAPDLVWIKNRTALNTDEHKLVDAVRGPTLELSTDSTAVEDTNTDGLRSFDADGFTLDAGAGGYNDSAETFIAWCFNEGVLLDVVAYTGDVNASQTVAHSLGAAPRFMMVKNRDAIGDWFIYHATNTGFAQYIPFGSGLAVTSDVWNNTAPDASNFSVGGLANTDGENYIAYLFPDVPGLTKIGSYTGNGLADGPQIPFGFRPRFFLLKNIAAASTNWILYDTVRDTVNPVSNPLKPNVADAEASGVDIDILSDGIKHRTALAAVNGSGNTIVYFAIADAASGGTLPPIPAGFPVDLDAVTADVPASILTAPTLSGTVQIGLSLLAAEGAEDGTEPITTTYEFRHADDTVIQAFSASNTYTIQASDYNQQIKVVQRAAGSGAPATRESALTVAVPGIAPTITGSPTVDVSGGIQVGDDGIVSITSAGATGTPTPDAPAFDLRDVATPGVVHAADPLTYVWQAGDQGRSFFVRQTSTNAEGSDTADSAPIGPIDPANDAPTPTQLPIIAHVNLEVGTATTQTQDSTWDGFPTPVVTRQWFRSDDASPTGPDTAIPGATGVTYTPVNPDDVGKYLYRKDTGSNVAGTASVNSNILGPFVDGTLSIPSNVTPPTISAATDLLEGSTLNTTDGAWNGNPAPTFNYRWTRGGVPISGATSSSYVIQAADVGQIIRCEVQGTNSEGSSAYVASSNSLTPQSLPENTVAPVISSADLEVGTVFTVTNDGTWTGEPASFTYSYQWKSGTTNVGTDQNTYTPVVGDIGNIITCEVTTSNAAGASLSPGVSNGLGPVIADSGGTLWTPNEIIDAIEFWVDANDATTITDTVDGVQVWADKSGNSRNVVQNTVTRRPDYNATGFNAAYGSVAGDEVDDYLTGDPWTKPTGALSVFTVFEWAGGARSEIYRNAGNAESGGTRLSIGATGAFFGNAAPQMAGFLSTGTPQLFYEELDAGSSNVEQRGYANGDLTVTASQTVTSRGTLALSHFIASYDASVGFSAVEINQVLIFNRQLTTVERQKLEGWAAHGAGMTSVLPVGHPYKSTAPTV